MMKLLGKVYYVIVVFLAMVWWKLPKGVSIHLCVHMAHDMSTGRTSSLWPEFVHGTILPLFFRVSHSRRHLPLNSVLFGAPSDMSCNFLAIFMKQPIIGAIIGNCFCAFVAVSNQLSSLPQWSQRPSKTFLQQLLLPSTLSLMSFPVICFNFMDTPAHYYVAVPSVVPRYLAVVALC